MARVLIMLVYCLIGAFLTEAKQEPWYGLKEGDNDVMWGVSGISIICHCCT